MFKLKVGKRYRNRQGDVIEIINKAILTTHSYEGSDGEYYRYNGRAGFFKDNPLDLIEETQDQITIRPSPWSEVVAGMFDGSYNKAA